MPAQPAGHEEQAQHRFMLHQQPMWTQLFLGRAWPYLIISQADPQAILYCKLYPGEARLQKE